MTDAPPRPAAAHPDTAPTPDAPTPDAASPSGAPRTGAAPARPNASILPTAQQTIGPFFPATFFRDGDNDLTRLTPDAPPTTRGTRIVLHGIVTREGGAPCVNAILEAWQADAGGRFNHPLDPARHLADPDFLGWGRAWTDTEGRYAFHTILPGPYAEAGIRRAPHVNLTVMGAGLMRRVRTVAFFPMFGPENADDPILTLVPESRRPHLITTPDGEAEGHPAYRLDIRLRGPAEEETPHFED
ncbi:protocatechuate 3,4-dioxygenase subunit alpha [Roseomonas sp. CCTCC AB2023176]|uniref:protocatechuate 3,4-dioxygenase subunit alpha n=1 Tax=Roseomonas sp. CCTCC AB2023176 TaxID=3342640 RepID=UPI0035E20B50